MRVWKIDKLPGISPPTRSQQYAAQNIKTSDLYEAALNIIEELSDDDLAQLRSEINFELDKRAQDYMMESLEAGDAS